MVLHIVFVDTLERPLSYDWGTNVYEACPACISAHELRTCDGETAVTFHLCKKHATLCDDNNNTEKVLLNEIRRMMHPLYSAVPLPGVSRQELGKDIKISVVSEKPEPKKRFNFRNKSASTDVARELLPYPTIRYAHAEGCNYSEQPQVVVKSAEEVQMMDQFAKQRLLHIKALLAADVDAILDDQGRDARDCIDEFIKQQRQERELECRSRSRSRSRSHWEFDSNSDLSSPAASASPCASTGSLMSGRGSGHGRDPGATVVGDHDSNTTANKLKLKHKHHQNRHLHIDLKLAFETDARKTLVAEMTRLEQSIPLSRPAKALYFKRCNGEYRNGVGDILVKNDVVSSRSPWAPISANNYGYAVLKPSKASGSDHSAPASSPAEPSSSSSSSSSTSLDGDFLARLPPPTRFKFTTDILMAREDMVRTGAVGAYDLCLTCWDFNRLERTATVNEK
ncbi:hypothetical protein A1O3_05821 [Capronia epimyces CBS 606.96]|uniref:Uncharacterized protein n=1 Tax=Capronia epimyces CBS 606.96 TaxID=1182542 RepID=W9Y7C1_9EURO|nr:uncharacterized protein A1O3_05821 [Capronia epimyces CBS 606.96]EXJ85146.1 hypothetical protein A1O3_05821 [Capronia epimyces CBS 606.96]